MSRFVSNILRLAFLASLSLCFYGSATAQIVRGEGMDSGLGGNNSVVGTVYDPSGKRISRRIQVRVSTMTRGDRISMTDENGNFSFRGLVSGTYTLIIDKEKDYEPFTQPVEIIQLGGTGGTYTLNIRLKLKRGTEPKPGVVNADLANVPQRALGFYSNALELAKAGDRKGAVEQLQLAVSEHPKFMLAFNEIGVQYLRMNELEKADEALRSALTIEPEAFAPLTNRGIVLVSMKRFGEAEPVLRSALKINEESAVVHYFLGQALANLGRFDEAEKELRSSIKLGGAEVKEAHRILAIIYGSRGDRKRSAAELEMYLRLAPTAPDAEQLRNAIKQLKGSDPPSPTNKPT